MCKLYLVSGFKFFKCFFELSGFFPDRFVFLLCRHQLLLFLGQQGADLHKDIGYRFPRQIQVPYLHLQFHKYSIDQQ